jgi:ferredoxin--NADP+ reductase
MLTRCQLRKIGRFARLAPRQPAGAHNTAYWYWPCSVIWRWCVSAGIPTGGIRPHRSGGPLVHRIIHKDILATDIVRFWVEAPHIARKRRPGQFVIVRLDETGERIPLTIADSDVRCGGIALVVQGVGKTTRALNALEAGDSILDVAGPLGRPTHIEPGKRVCCIGGGIGAAVALPIARGFKERDGRVSAILGARTKELVILEPEIKAVADRYLVTTDDGSYGMHGLVTHGLQQFLAEGIEFDEVIAIGPLPMMRAVCELTRPIGLSTTVSLNPVMVDGTGMCGGCRVSVNGEPKFVCVDGPEFDGHQVDFDELAARLTAYREQEAVAAQRVECRSAAPAAIGG